MNRTVCSILLVGACVLLCGCLGEYFGTKMPDRLRQQGINAEATIINIWDTGWTINDDPVIGMRVEVHPSDQPAFVGTINRYVVSRISVAQYQPGRTVRVRFDPADHTAIAVDNTESTSAPGVSAETRARTQAADVVELRSDYEIPQAPNALRGLKVLMIYTLVQDSTPSQSEDLRMRGCRDAGLALFDRIGWWLVHDSSETHDIVVRGECATSASFLATGAGLFVLLPTRAQGMRIETTAGAMIEQLQPIARTLKCPTRAQDQCAQAVKEYVAANLVGQISASRSLQEFVELHVARH
jgi:hypothetical protein